MTTQFRRAYTLEIGEADPLGLTKSFAVISGDDALRIAFEIEKTELPWPNRARLQIWNLSPDHRAYLTEETALPCRLEAGYSGGAGELLNGTIRRATSEHQGSDWITLIEVGEGVHDKDGALLASKSIKKAWARGTPVAAIVADFAKELNVDIGNVPALAAAASFSSGPALLHGFAVDGPILDEWTHLMRGLGLRWSIQGGAIQLRLPDAPAGLVPLISPFTGLVDRVSVSTKQIKRTNVLTKKEEVQSTGAVEGKCLLLPGLQPGYQFLLQSGAATGAYLCSRVTHRGDSYGQEWYTEFEGLA